MVRNDPGMFILYHKILTENKVNDTVKVDFSGANATC